MAGKGYINHGKNIWDDMYAAIDSAHKRLDMIIGASKQPTMPTYPFATANPGDLPDDPIQGQVAISGDDDTMWFYSNGAWHQVGNKVEWAYCSASDSSGSFPTSNTGTASRFPLLLSASDDGLDGSYLTSDNGKYTINATGGLLMPAGVWLCQAALQIVTPDSVSSLLYAGLSFAAAPADDSSSNVGGPWRSTPVLTSGGFHNYFLEDAAPVNHLDPLSAVYYTYSGQTGIIASVTNWEIGVLVAKLGPHFDTWVLH